MKHCIVNLRDEEIIQKLNELGYICHNVISSDRVSSPISAHSDVLYNKINESTVMISACQKKNINLLTECGYNVIIIDELKPGYKTECKLNFIINEKYIIRNPATAINLKHSKKEINVKQGYTRCSTICVTDTAFITDDENIFKTITENGLDCLKIEKGNIRLDGYNYGFIGGASVKLNDSEILFFGDIKNKYDKNAVVEFLKKYDMTAIFIKNKIMNDIGSAMIL